MRSLLHFFASFAGPDCLREGESPSGGLPQLPSAILDAATGQSQIITLTRTYGLDQGQKWFAERDPARLARRRLHGESRGRLPALSTTHFGNFCTNRVRTDWKGSVFLGVYRSQQRIANPPSPVRIREGPVHFFACHGFHLPSRDTVSWESGNRSTPDYHRRLNTGACYRRSAELSKPGCVSARWVPKTPPTLPITKSRRNAERTFPPASLEQETVRLQRGDDAAHPWC